jgi:hypothetical protein
MYQSRLLMVLEVFCYARGIYDSNEVTTHARQDPDLSPIFNNRFPDQAVIKRFRRAHREPIKTCLLKIFDLGFRVRFGEPDTDEAPIDYCVTCVMDTWFEPMCGPQPDQEAEHRLSEAVFSDNVLNAD